MAIGASGSNSHVPTTCPVSGAGAQPAAARVGAHVSGSGSFPGEGAKAGQPTPQHPGNTHRTSGLK
jgi:hypothetical protein